jgi:hypothetical protein
LSILAHRAVVGGMTVYAVLKAVTTSAERLQPVVGKIAASRGKTKHTAEPVSNELATAEALLIAAAAETKAA